MWASFPTTRKELATVIMVGCSLLTKINPLKNLTREILLPRKFVRLHYGIGLDFLELGYYCTLVMEELLSVCVFVYERSLLGRREGWGLAGNPVIVSH